MRRVRYLGLALLGASMLAALCPPSLAQDAVPDVPVPAAKPGAEAPPVPQSPGQVEDDLSTNFVTLGGLDKVTARVVTIKAEVGQTTHFGTLEIIVRACRKHPPEESPENAAFLDIWDIKPGKPAQSVFRGWMFSSSPALSAMEHPIYDIWVLSCDAQPK